MNKGISPIILILTLAMFTILSGCSNDNPATFVSDDTNTDTNNNSPMLNTIPGEALVYEVAFRDTIVSIDYGNETFTVANRTETITTDSNTFIWTQIIINTGGPHGDIETVSSPSASAKGQPQNYIYTSDSVLQFSDLKIGSIVEVRANIVDPSTLLAGKIKVVNCTYQEECFEFTDVLASVDVALGMVTFVTESRIGTVCQNTVLTGLDGETLILADFMAGDNVFVKGRIIADDTLKVGAMTKIE